MKTATTKRMTVADASGWLQRQGWPVHPETVRELIRSGRLLAQGGGGRGRAWMIERSDLEALWRSRSSRETEDDPGKLGEVRAWRLFEAETALILEREARHTVQELVGAYGNAGEMIRQTKGAGSTWQWRLPEPLARLRAALDTAAQRPEIPYRPATVHRLRLAGMSWKEIGGRLNMTTRNAQRLEHGWRERFGTFTPAQIEDRAKWIDRQRTEFLAREGRAAQPGGDPAVRTFAGAPSRRKTK